MFRSRPEDFRLHLRADGDGSVAPAPNDRNLTNPAQMLGAVYGRLWVRARCSCRCLRLGVQGKEAHHVASDGEPQQMDAGLELAAQG